MDVEDLLELVGIIRQDVAAVGVPCTAVQVVVLGHQPLQLALRGLGFRVSGFRV